MSYTRIKIISVITFFSILFPFHVALAEHDSTASLSIGGRIKIDTIYNENSASGPRKSKSDLALSPGSIPLTDTRDDFDIHPRESRIWATVHLPVLNGDLSGYVEFDFFDTERDAAGVTHVANKPRLRHLYTSYKNLIVGQTFTTFVNMSAFPEINDANGPVGVHSIRQPLIRYRLSLDFSEIELAVEHTESTFRTSTGSSIQVNDDHLPDIVGKFTMTDSWGNLSFSAMARQVHNNGKVTNGIDDKIWGGAISTAGRIFINGQDNLRFTVSYGNVLGRYVSYGVFNDAVMATNGSINLTEIFTGHVAFQHWWSAKLRSSVVIGAAYGDIDTSNTVTSVNKYLASSMLNLIWSPTVSSSIGIEWLHGYRKQYDGQSGNIDRMQLSAIYKFQ